MNIITVEWYDRNNKRIGVIRVPDDVMVNFVRRKEIGHIKEDAHKIVVRFNDEFSTTYIMEKDQPS